MMALITRGIILLLLFDSCCGLTLPKIFTEGMVLQSTPTGATIWGFLDGDFSPVLLTSNCNSRRSKTQTFIPKQVRCRFYIPSER